MQLPLGFVFKCIRAKYRPDPPSRTRSDATGTGTMPTDAIFTPAVWARVEGEIATSEVATSRGRRVTNDTVANLSLVEHCLKLCVTRYGPCTDRRGGHECVERALEAAKQ